VRGSAKKQIKMSSTLPKVFHTPEGRGSAIHPILIALYYASPSLLNKVLQSNTDEKTLSQAVKKSWKSLQEQSADQTSSQPVWDLITEQTLIPADSAELFNQMCDLFDAELSDIAANCLGVKTKLILQSGARVKEGIAQSSYTIQLSIPSRLDIEGTSLTSLLKSNFETEKIDYMFPEDVEPVEADKHTRITSKFRECIVIQLQRYKYDFSLGGNAKIYDRVEFTEHIEGSEFVNYCDEATAKTIATCKLDLVGVITHNDDSGYGLLVKPDAKGSWFKCSDLDNHVPMESSIESCFGGEADQDVAYMLFYRVSGGESVLDTLSRKMSRKSIGKTNTPAVPAASKAADTAAGGGGGCCVVM
jgi:hypothetical protein